MKIESAILNNIKKLPESIKQSVLLYTEFLVSQYAKEVTEVSEEAIPKKHRLAGSMKGTLRGGLGIWKGKIWIADDFDEPLEDFAEYM